MGEGLSQNFTFFQEKPRVTGVMPLAMIKGAKAWNLKDPRWRTKQNSIMIETFSFQQLLVCPDCSHTDELVSFVIETPTFSNDDVLVVKEKWIHSLNALASVQ